MASSAELAATAAAAAAWLAFETLLYADPPARRAPGPAPEPPAPGPAPGPRSFVPPSGPLPMIVEESRGWDWDPEAPFGFWSPATNTAKIRHLIRLAEIREYFDPTEFFCT